MSSSKKRPTRRPCAAPCAWPATPASRWIRQGFLWSDIEIAGKGDYVDRRAPDPARSAWDKYDFIVDQAQAFSLEILARLDAQPGWARSAPNPTSLRRHQVVIARPPANVDDYADFVGGGRRYKGKVRYFQIWNEPNLIGDGRPQPDPAAYTALLKAAYQAAHAANPDAVILMAPLRPGARPAPVNTTTSCTFRPCTTRARDPTSTSPTSSSTA